MQEFKYRPPFKFLFTGVGGLVMATMIGMVTAKTVIGDGEIWLIIPMSLFCIIALLMGIAMLLLYFKKFGGGPLRLGSNCIEIPGRWKQRMQVNFDEIENISEFATYDHVIEIQSQNFAHLIEQSWMKKEDFESVRSQLIQWADSAGKV